MSEASKPPETAVSAAPTAVAAPAAAKPAPAKPAPPKAGATRRDFLETIGLSWGFLGWGSFILSMLGMLLYTVRFLFNNAPPQLKSEFRAGTVEDYEPEVVDDKTKENGFWVIKHREGSQVILYALSTTCTHLGCTPNWLAGERKFKCPCHGSGFYITGVNFEGPAPRPMERYSIRLDGTTVVVDKSKKYQRELGQWESSESFLLV